MLLVLLLVLSNNITSVVILNAAPSAPVQMARVKLDKIRIVTLVDYLFNKKKNGTPSSFRYRFHFQFLLVVDYSIHEYILLILEFQTVNMLFRFFS